jgi:hypothetical protein
MIDYFKLQQLSDKVKNNSATQLEKDEYMAMLYNNGSITKNQYDKYLSDKNATDTIGAAVTIGGIILLGYLISKLVGSDND